MNAAQARAILAQAQEDQIYEGEIPSEDEKAISDAENIVQLAQEAWDALMRGPEVEAILKLAANGSAPESDNGSDTPSTDDAPSDSQQLDPETVAVLERAEQRVEDWKQEAREAGIEPDAEPEPEETGEPIEGYDQMKLREIYDALDSIVAQEGAGSTLDKIERYEKAHKNRMRVLDRITVKRREIGHDGAQQEEEAPREPEAEGPAPEEPTDDHDAGRADEAEEGERSDPQSGIEPAADAEGAPAGEGEEREADEAAPDAEAGRPDGAQHVAIEVDADLIKQVEEELARERLVIPDPPAEDLPQIPWDWTKISDKELHHLHGAYSAAAYYKNYQLQREERMAWHYRMQADELHRELLLAISKYDEKGKEKKVSVLEAEIESDPNVKMLRRKQRLCEVRATACRQERDQYSKMVESLSRNETMRQNEHERAGGLRRGR